MIRKLSGWISAFIFLWMAAPTIAQTPSDAIMMNDGQICLFAIYTNESWDEYWEGTLLRENGNIGKFTRQTITPGLALGLGKRLNVIAMFPWVTTDSDGGYFKGVSGLQDWGLWVKGKVIDAHTKPGDFTFHATTGLTIPISNYLPDYTPYSLGLGSLDFTLRGILQYKMHAGPYLRGQAGYHMRGNSTIERDYYYTTFGIYSDKVDMPNAVTYSVNLGSWLLDNKLKIEVAYEGLNTLAGHDIRRQDAGFPSNKMIYTQIGGSVQVYPGQTGFGILAGAGKVLTGRNLGKSTMFMGGITYQFGLWNKDETEVISN